VFTRWAILEKKPTPSLDKIDEFINTLRR